MLKLDVKKRRITLYVLALVIAAAAFIAAWKFYEQYSWKEKTKAEAEYKLKGEVRRIQKFILSIEQIPQNLAYVLEFSNPRKEELNLLLKSVIENTDEVFGACIAFEPHAYYKDSTYFAPYLYNRGGEIVSVNASDTTDYYFSEDWYLIPKRLKKPVWIEPYYDEGSTGGQIVLSTYSIPFYKFDGAREKFNGIIAIDISMDWLSKVVSNIKLYENSYCVLVSENGTVISSPNPQWPYNESIFSLSEEFNQPVLRTVGRNLQKGKSGFVDAGTFGTDKEWWIYYMPIPANKWGILLIVPKGK
ncbi:MAG TPA: cache domain-containing protein [Ignavibacteriales bacterium]|nr:cache domain-containing protein [Ignavibacteriales bacterium]